MSQVAKLFNTGSSQAVRLPRAYRFDTTEVFIRRDPETGDVNLSRKPATLEFFFAALDDTNASQIFRAPSLSYKSLSRDPFEGWKE